MSTQRATNPAFSVVVGISLVSSGMVGMLLASHPTSPPPVNPCAAKLTAAVRGAAPHGWVTTEVRSASIAAPGPSPAATRAPTSSASATATPSSDPSSSSPSTSLSPSPGTSPVSSTSASPSPTASSPTPRTSGSPSPSPSPSPSTSAASAHLCLDVQALAGKTGVRPGGRARFAIWVWFAGKRHGTATVRIAAKPGKLWPAFTVCQAPGKATCTVGLAAAQPVELQARVAVPKKETAGTRITLTARGTSPQASAPTSASGHVLVRKKATPSPSPSGTGSTPTGAGVTLPPGMLPPGILPGLLPSNSLPVLPDPAANPEWAFPKISPSPDPTPAPSAHPIRVTDVSAQFPLDTRLIGGQLVGLAVLAAAVTIAVARLSLRRQKPSEEKDPG